MATEIKAKEKLKVATDLAHREHSSEEMEPTIAKAEEVNAKSEKKMEKELTKIGTDNTKKWMGEAKTKDAEMKKITDASKPKPKKAASLVQQTKVKQVIKLQKQKP